MSTSTSPTRFCTWLHGDKSTAAACPRPAPQALGDIPPGEPAGRPDRRESTCQKTSLSFLPLHVWHETKTAVWLPRGASTYALMKSFHLVFQAFWCFKQPHIWRPGVTFPRFPISHHPTHENLFLTPLKSHSPLHQGVSNSRTGPISIKISSVGLMRTLAILRYRNPMQSGLMGKRDVLAHLTENIQGSFSFKYKLIQALKQYHP